MFGASAAAGNTRAAQSAPATRGGVPGPRGGLPERARTEDVRRCSPAPAVALGAAAFAWLDAS